MLAGTANYARYGAFLDERPNLFDPLIQTRVQPDRSRRVEQSADGVDQACDAVLRERRGSSEVRPVLALHQIDVDLTILGSVAVERIHAEVVASIDDSIERLLVGEVERRLRDQENERYRPSPVLLIARAQLVVESIRLFFDDSRHSLVDDLCGDRHYLRSPALSVRIVRAGSVLVPVPSPRASP